MKKIIKTLMFFSVLFTLTILTGCDFITQGEEGYWQEKGLNELIEGFEHVNIQDRSTELDLIKEMNADEYAIWAEKAGTTLTKEEILDLGEKEMFPIDLVKQVDVAEFQEFKKGKENTIFFDIRMHWSRSYFNEYSNNGPQKYIDAVKEYNDLAKNNQDAVPSLVTVSEFGNDAEYDFDIYYIDENLKLKYIVSKTLVVEKSDYYYDFLEFAKSLIDNNGLTEEQIDILANDGDIWDEYFGITE